MKDLADVIRAAYASESRREIEATLSAARDALESSSGSAANIRAVVSVLLDELGREKDPEIIEWTLEALGSATFHPDFGTANLQPLVDFGEAETEWLGQVLEILGTSRDARYRSLVAKYIRHPDPRVAAAATEALAELDAGARG